MNGADFIHASPLCVVPACEQLLAPPSFALVAYHAGSVQALGCSKQLIRRRSSSRCSCRKQSPQLRSRSFRRRRQLACLQKVKQALSQLQHWKLVGTRRGPVQGQLPSWPKPVGLVSEPRLPTPGQGRSHPLQGVTRSPLPPAALWSRHVHLPAAGAASRRTVARAAAQRERGLPRQLWGGCRCPACRSLQWRSPS